MKTKYSNNKIISTLLMALFALTFCVADANAQTSILCGQTITNSISAAGENDQYTYGGSAGETLAVAMQGLLTINNVKVVELYNPSGQIIARLNGFSALSSNVTLAVSGTYTFLVHDDNYTDTGTYALSINSVTGGGCASTPIACGQTVTNTINQSSEMDAYSYVGNAGETLAVAMQGLLTINNVKVVELYNPSGQIIARLNGFSALSSNVTLAVSGTYTFLVHDDNYTDTGVYGLSIQSVIAGGCSSKAISCGQLTSTNISRRAQVDAFGFGGSAGATVLFSFTGFGGAQFDLYDPSGVKQFTKTPATSTNFTLPTTGAYTLLVHDDNYTDTGTYSFSATICTGCNYLISPNSVSASASGTNGTVSVAVEAGCNWTATTNVDWLSINGAADGSGNGTVNFSVAPNISTNARAGTMTIAGWSFYVNQAAIVGGDIGNPGAAGSFTLSNGIYTVSGSGEDIEDTADDFYFVHQTHYGDCQIVARVLSLQGPNPLEGEAGIMIRESVDAGSKHAFLQLNTTTNMGFRRRLATDAYSADNIFPITNRPWLRLMRMGNTLVAHCSADGVNWEYVWFTTMTMSNQVEVGLAVTARHNGLMATATLDNVSIASLSPLPGNWPLAGPQILLGGEPEGAIEFQRQGGFRFLIGGVVGDSFNIRTSPEIDAPVTSWSTLGNATNIYGVVPFLDNAAPTGIRRFYRAEKVAP